MYFKISKFFIILPVLGIAIVTTSTLFPFIVGKYVWFRATVDLAFIFFLLGIIFHPEAKAYEERFFKLVKSPLFLAVTAFVFIFILAGFFGVDPVNSFWSNFERGEGGLQLIHLWVFFTLLAVLFREEDDWRRIFGWSLVGGILMTLYGVFAGWGYQNFIGPKFGDPGFRFQGSIGNPAYVASYAIFMLFYALYLFWGRKNNNKFFSARALGYYFLFAIFAAVFLAAATRGAFVGLFLSILAFLIYLVYVHKNWRKWLLLSAVVLLLVGGSLVYFKDSPFVKSLPFGRIFDISFSAETFKHRAIMWKIALDGWKERPILGWGPENYLYVFDSRFNTAYFQPPAPFGAWFDRAHSIYFDYLVETGIVGLLSFLSIFAVFYWLLFQKTRMVTDDQNQNPRTQEPKNQKTKGPVNEKNSVPVMALMFALPVAYLVQGIVLFDVWPMYINVFLFFAFSVYKFFPITKKA
jgi:O-antigen ligase